jgi:glutathione S-transferase
MKLYYSPGACSLSPHIVLLETGTPVTLVKVDLATKTLADGSDYRTVNPDGYVPVLELDDGSRLTEGPAIVQYIADAAGAQALAPANGTMARYRLQSMLNYISTELHKGFSPLFNPRMPEEAKALARERLAERIGSIEARLATSDHLMGEAFTVADAYLFTVLSWSRMVGVSLTPFPRVRAYIDRIRRRPAVVAAMKAEGLVK